jgi:murein DD-endopeptidase MepM/ murein hydrolase activator NlpD
MAPPGILIPSPTPPSLCPLLWLGRPIPPGFDQRVDTSYPFGSTEGGTLEPHHGVDLPNPLGTPVVAAASGTVVFAGDDDQVLLGPSFEFYGNTVVLQLDRQTEGGPIFLLQGHLNDISIKVGQHVSPGDLIGRVGVTGVAIGAHLHFEVRVGTNEYTSVRNPELWLAPRTEAGITLGALAGRVVDSSGNSLPGRTVTLRKRDSSGSLRTVRYLTTYDLEPGTSGSDDSLQENFAATDLEPGSYEISVFSSKLQSGTATVKPGKLSWVDLGSGQDPLPACAP